MTGFVIAIDGPAASGKGTVAAQLARVLGLPYLDTGLLYRAVGYAAAQPGRSEADAVMLAQRLMPETLDNPALRTREAGELASRVAVMPAVRQALFDFQRDFARRPGGAVLDGRDIGTVICPEAPAKLFVTARPQVRAERRWKQLTGQGEAVSFEDVLADIRIRDARDSGREAAPLAQAADAVLLDTSEMTIDEAADAARRIVEAARALGGSCERDALERNPTAPFPRAAAGDFTRAGCSCAFGSTPNPTSGNRPRCGSDTAVIRHERLICLTT